MFGVFNAGQENEYHLPLSQKQKESDFLLTALKQVNMDTLDFALALVDWCEKNKCNGPGQRLSLVKLIEEWSEPRYKEYQKEIIRLTGMIEDSFKRDIRISMPGIPHQEQGEAWKLYKELNKLK